MLSKRRDARKAKIIDHAICLQCSSGVIDALNYLAAMGVDQATINRVMFEESFRNKFYNRTERF